MALSKIQDFRDLSDEALTQEILAAKRQLFDLRFQKATRQLENSHHQFKHLKHRIAQMMTVERERELAKAAAEAEVATPQD